GNYTAQWNIINNYFKPGPVTKPGQIHHRIVKPESGRSNLDYKVYGRAYVHGNIMYGNEKVTENNWNGGVQLEGMDGEELTLKEAKEFFPEIKVESPFPMPTINIMTAKEAYHFVLKHVGATLPVRDSVDLRVVKQVRTGKIDYLKNFNADTLYQFKYRRLEPDSYKKGIITNPVEVGGYPDYAGS